MALYLKLMLDYLYHSQTRTAGSIYCGTRTMWGEAVRAFQFGGELRHNCPI
jgi:hypothetical protein